MTTYARRLNSRKKVRKILGQTRTEELELSSTAIGVDTSFGIDSMSRNDARRLSLQSETDGGKKR
ncbi:hypothetical protein C0995_016346 [Termitomyces sp. Mi166|nr:hypothetical protein C0995_016346 [Termitomyces sp. Mi166\